MMARAGMLVLVCLATACQGERAEDQVEPPSETEKAASLPPGFLDAAPEPPSSDTLVLSGGMLMTDPPTPDSVVVIQNGTLLAWGARGETDMPNDSIGIDFRNKWLLPRLPMRVGETARFDIYDGFPDDPTKIIGKIDGVDMDLPEAD